MSNVALQIQRLASGCVAPRSNVIFESIISSSGDIGYDNTTGVITINEAGRYVFHWWVAAECTCPGGAIFALSSLTGEPVVGNLPPPNGQAVGLAVFDVDAPPTQFSLENCGQTAVRYADCMPVKASLLVTRHARNTLENLVDGNNVGALRGIGTRDNYTMGLYATALGFQTTASGDYSYAQGRQNIASDFASHAEGFENIASSDYSHVQGVQNTAASIAAHAEGAGNIASGVASHAEGSDTVASAQLSHTEGAGTKAGYSGAHIMGRYGDANAAYSWFLANGTNNQNRSLAAKILSSGDAYAAAWHTTGADYAEMFETADGKSIEPGFFVTFDAGEKIRKAEDPDGYILGVSAAVSGIVGDAGALHWKDKYQTDAWGAIRYHDVEVPERKDRDGKVIMPAHTETQPVLNPEWNPERAYVPRAKRPEWVLVGLLGKLLIRDDGTCVADGYCVPGAGGVATAAASGYRVMKRTGENQVQIMLK